jgi:hypothetical protein
MLAAHALRLGTMMTNLYTPHDAELRPLLGLPDVRLMHVDHFGVDDGVYRGLHEQFSVAEIVELGMMVAGLLGVHRFMRTLDLVGSAGPAIRYESGEVFRGAPAAGLSVQTLA